MSSEPLKGRENEFGAVLRFISDCLTCHLPQPAVLCVSGCCGSGKTETVLRASRASRGARFRRRPITHYINCVDLEPKALAEKIPMACAHGQRQSAHLEQLLKGLEDLRSSKVAVISPVADTPKFPLHVFVLDEADTLRGFAGGTARSYLHNLVLFALANRCFLSLILVSNARSFDVVPESNRHEVLFEAYSAVELRAIALESAGSVPISDSALEFAAKAASANFACDVRQLKTMVRRSSVIASGKRARDESDASSCLSALRTAPVNVQHMVQASSNNGSLRNFTILRTLPEQMLFVLCCCVQLLLKRGNQNQRTLHVADVSLTYKKLMVTKSFPVVSQQGINDILTNLADYGIVTRPRGHVFTVSIDAAMSELKGELISIGAESETNRLKEILLMDS
jgi:Cdc6-like AAA superfamily ATPase